MEPLRAFPPAPPESPENEGPVVEKAAPSERGRIRQPSAAAAAAAVAQAAVRVKKSTAAPSKSRRLPDPAAAKVIAEAAIHPEVKKAKQQDIELQKQATDAKKIIKIKDAAAEQQRLEVAWRTIGDKFSAKAVETAIEQLWLDLDYGNISTPPRNIRERLQKKKLKEAFPIGGRVNTIFELRNEFAKIKTEMAQQIFALTQERALKEAQKQVLIAKRAEKKRVEEERLFAMSPEGAIKAIKLAGKEVSIIYIDGEPHLAEGNYVNINTGAVMTSAPFRDYARPDDIITCVDKNGKSPSSNKPSFCDSVLRNAREIVPVDKIKNDAVNMRLVPHAGKQSMLEQFIVLLKLVKFKSNTPLQRPSLPPFFDSTVAPWVVNPYRPNDSIWTNRESVLNKIVETYEELEGLKMTAAYKALGSE